MMFSDEKMRKKNLIKNGMKKFWNFTFYGNLKWKKNFWQISLPSTWKSDDHCGWQHQKLHQIECFRQFFNHRQFQHRHFSSRQKCFNLSNQIQKWTIFLYSFFSPSIVTLPFLNITLRLKKGVTLRTSLTFGCSRQAKTPLRNRHRFTAIWLHLCGGIFIMLMWCKQLAVSL